MEKPLKRLECACFSKLDPALKPTGGTIQRIKMVQGRYVFPFSQLRMTDVDRVGGKNASLGELLSQLTSAGIRVPDGFATTAEAFRLFLREGGLEDRIHERLKTLNVDDVKALAAAGAEIRGWIENAPFPAELEKEIREFYEWRHFRRRALVGHCGRSSGRFFCRPAGNRAQCERH